MNSNHDKKDEKLILSVMEAMVSDAGHGIARIDQDTISKAGIASGDIVELRGKKRTVAKFLPFPVENLRKDIIQIDGLVRNNLGVGIGDTVSVRKIKAVAAEKIVVAPLEAIPPIDERYLADALEGMPLIKGDNVLVPYFGGRLTFQVIGITPIADAVTVDQKTIFHIAQRTEKLPDFNEKIHTIIDKILQMENLNSEEFESMMNLIRNTYDEFKKNQNEYFKRNSK